MRIIEISIKLGETVNLGNYSNYRPEISATAEIGLGENVGREMTRLTRLVQEQLEEMVDDALEQAEMEPKYTSRLFGVRINRLRGVVVVYDKRLTLPEQETWRDKDHWKRVDGLGHFMRLDSAVAAANEVRNRTGFIECFAERQEQFDELPDLPDPGPAPQWYVKELQDGLRKLNIPSATWEQVGDLNHVTTDYLDKFYTWYHRDYPSHISTSRMVDMFIAGETPWANAVVAPAPDEADEEE